MSRLIWTGLLVSVGIAMLVFSGHRLLLQYYVIPAFALLEQVQDDNLSVSDLGEARDNLQEAIKIGRDSRQIYGLLADLLLQSQQRDLGIAQELGGGVFSSANEENKKLTQQRFDLYREGLRVAPSDGGMWLAMAEAKQDLRGLDANAFSQFWMSYRTDRMNSFYAERRLLLGIQALDGLPTELKSLVRQDIAILLSNNYLSRVVAEVYVESTSEGKAFIEEAVSAHSSSVMLSFQRNVKRISQ